MCQVHSSDTDKEIIVRLMKRMAVEISDDEELDMVDVYGRASRRESPRVTPAEGLFNILIHGFHNVAVL